MIFGRWARHENLSELAKNQTNYDSVDIRIYQTARFWPFPQAQHSSISIDFLVELSSERVWN